jgi:hypothetical protein
LPTQISTLQTQFSATKTAPAQTIASGVTVIDVLCTKCYVLFIVKAIPLKAWTGPEDSRRMRLPDFKIIGTCRW